MQLEESEGPVPEETRGAVWRQELSKQTAFSSLGGNECNIEGFSLSEKFQLLKQFS